MSDSKSIWVFGDSFMTGWGFNHDWCINNIKEEDSLTLFEKNNPLYPFRQWEYKYQNDSFDVLLSNHLNGIRKNYALPGMNNENTINTIWKYLPYFKSNDVVIIGETKNLRLHTHNKGRNTMSLYESVISSLVYNRLKDEFEVHLPLDIDDKYRELIKTYFLEIVVRNEEHLDTYYRKVYTSIIDYLLTKNIKPLLITPDTWGLVPDITTWSKENTKYDTVVDSHWGLDGHCTVFNNVVSCINEGIYILERENFSYSNVKV